MNHCRHDYYPVCAGRRQGATLYRKSVFLRISAILSLLAFTLSYLEAQQRETFTTPEITIETIAIDNNQITILYDIEGCSEGTLYDVSLAITTLSGASVKPNMLLGDVGPGICGPGKMIVWDLARETREFDEELWFQILADRVELTQADAITTDFSKSYSRSGIIFSSLVVPGLGQKRVSGDGLSLLMAPLFYGSAGGALLMHLSSENHYDKYRNTASISDRDDYFAIAEARNQSSRALLIGAAGIMAVNLIWTGILPLDPPTRGLSLNIATDNISGVWQTGVRYRF